VKALMLSWEFRPNIVGGLGRAVTEVADALAQQGVEVSVVTSRPGDLPEREDGEGICIRRVRPPEQDVHDIFTMADETSKRIIEIVPDLLERAGPVDLIHTHDWHLARAAITLKHQLKVPLVATIHATEYGRHRGHISSDLSHSINGLEWELTYDAWRVICCSRFMAGEVQTAFGCPADKIDVIPNGIDPSPFDAIRGLDLRRFRATYARPDEKIVFCVGRVVYEKGAHVLVEAFPRILAEYPFARLVVTGDGPNLPAVRERARQLGIADRCHFTGFVPIDVRNRLFRIADVAVFPSLYEPFGIVALEAMAAGAPVVVSNVGGLAEVVEHAETGILVYPNDVGSLAWGVLHTLLNPQWARMRAANAYRIAVSEYSWRNIARQTMAVYERVVTERKLASW
jgi:glycogen synthase